MTEDWLDIDLPEPVHGERLQKPADNTLPAPLGPSALRAADEAILRRAQFVMAWESLKEGQQVFLNTWRECRFNARRAMRLLEGTRHSTSKTTVSNWGGNPSFEMVRDAMREASVEEILNRANLVARQDDIVETLLTPKPILFQGQHTGYEEVDASAAARANETLLKVGGHLKDKDLEINVGVVGPSFAIQVVQPDGVLVDITPKGVIVDLPQPTDSEWLDAV